MKKLAVLTLSAALTALSLMFTPLSFLAWFALAPFIYLTITETEKKKKPVKMYFTSLLWSFVYYFVIYHWFTYLYPMEFMGVNKLEAIGIIFFCWAGLSLLQAIGTAFVPLVFRLTAKHKFLYPWLFASVWTLFEWFQTLTWMGVPWARLALSQAPFPVFIQSASLFGSLFISFIIVLVNGFIACAVYEFIDGGIKAKSVRKYAVFAAAVFLANTLFGSVALMLHKNDESRKINALLVQGNISSGEKWNSTSSPLDLYISLSYDGVEKSEKPIDIILWPETVINYYMLGSERAVEQTLKLASDTGAVVFAGTFDYSQADVYNSIIAFYPDGSIDEHPYYKRHLVPFGEYLPMRDFISMIIPALADFNLLGDDLTAGTDPAIIEAAGGNVGRLVCFDSIYEELSRKSVADGAEIIILSTNDSWYLDSFAVYQHNRHASLRAVENGRWVLRAANTGISSIISSDGSVTVLLKPLVQGTVTGEAYFSSDRTLYSYIGDSFVILCAALVFTEAAFRVKEKTISKKKSKDA